MTWRHQGLDGDVTGYAVRLFVLGTNTEIVFEHSSAESYHIVQGADNLDGMYFVQVRSMCKSVLPSEHQNKVCSPRFNPGWEESTDPGVRLFP